MNYNKHLTIQETKHAHIIYYNGRAVAREELCRACSNAATWCDAVFARGGVSTRLFFPVHPPAHARTAMHPCAPTHYSRHARRHSREMRIL